MSHQGTNWAILQRGLKPTTKIVLWHLCDRSVISCLASIVVQVAWLWL